MLKINKYASSLFLSVFVLFGTTVGSTSAMADGEKFVLVSHAPDSDSWWNTIKNAIEVAGGQMGVTVDYRNPTTGDLADMARIVEQAAASNPDGIIVTIADYDVLKALLLVPLQKESQLLQLTLELVSNLKC